jgi:Ca2+-binding RTX toxin-like protein
MAIQTTNIDAASGDGIDVTTAFETLTIQANVVVQSEQANGVTLSGGTNELLNYGTVAAYDAAIFSWGSSPSLIVNETGGTASAENYGIYTQETGDTIINNGSVTGLVDGIIEQGPSGEAYIENNGYIYGKSIGVSTKSADEVFSTGTIRSAATGVLLGGGSSLENTGLIRGQTFSVYSAGIAAVLISNSGALDGNIHLTDSGGDTFTNKGSIAGAVQLGSGTNSFNGVRGTVDGTITGGSGVDTIHLGNDGETVDGGGGLDQIYGGTGADTFAFSHDGAANAATVHGFNVANDAIQLSHSLFTKLTAGATPTFSISAVSQSATDHLGYNATAGLLWYDSNGSAAGGWVEIARLAPGLKLMASNFTVV